MGLDPVSRGFHCSGVNVSFCYRKRGSGGIRGDNQRSRRDFNVHILEVKSGKSRRLCVHKMIKGQREADGFALGSLTLCVSYNYVLKLR